MDKLHPYWFVFLVSCLLMVGCCAYGQTYYYPNQEVRISDLPALTAKTANPSDVLATSMEIIFRDPAVCCGKNSALWDPVQFVDPTSLKNVGEKLQGRHLLSDGRPIMVTADFLPAASVSGVVLVGAINEKRALLMEWNSHLYVVYGVIFNRIVGDSEGTIAEVVHKVLLLDPRFSDDRRKVSFDPQTDDWGKVQGLLMLKAAPL